MPITRDKVPIYGMNSSITEINECLNNIQLGDNNNNTYLIEFRAEPNAPLQLTVKQYGGIVKSSKQVVEQSIKIYWFDKVTKKQYLVEERIEDGW